MAEKTGEKKERQGGDKGGDRNRRGGFGKGKDGKKGINFKFSSNILQVPHSLNPGSLLPS